MKKIAVTVKCCFAIVLLPCLRAASQSIPAGVGTGPTTGFELPQVNGSFNYALNASELISTGFFSSTGTQFTTALSGDATYTSRSLRHPFSAIYSGGVLLANSGQPNTVYQSLALSQSYLTKQWTFQLQDAVSYLPESPVSGLSGIPGVGDLGIDPVPLGADAGIGILTTYGPRISNTFSGSASRTFGRYLSAQASGYENIQRFVGDNSAYGADNSSGGVTGGLSYHLDGRNTLTGNYNYSNFTYVGTPFSFSTQSATFDYARKWSRRLSTDVYAGPQRISSTGFGSGQPSTQIAAGASAILTGRSAFYSLSYFRGANNGSGVTLGAFSDSVIGAVRRQFGRGWGVSGVVAFSRTTQLPSFNLATFSSDSVSVGGQVVHALGRRLSAYGSYTVQHQSTAGSATAPLSGLALNAFNGSYQVVGLGISYSPGSLFLNK